MRKTASGSPLYYPPEIVKGEAYDDKIDVWCIGMMTYECILGKIPFKVYTEMDLGRIVIVCYNIGFWWDNIPFVGWCDRLGKRLHIENLKKERWWKNVIKADATASFYHKAPIKITKYIYPRIIQKSSELIFKYLSKIKLSESNK